MTARTLPKDQRDRRVEQVTALCRLTELLDRHPYDLSGGEQQRAALGKVLLLEPEILLLDEPTKGLDAAFKQSFALFFRTLLTAAGTTVVMVSHDVAFCARYAHRCALFFDGSIVAEGTPRDFFSGNSFYTTSANRMARSLLPLAVTPEDVIAVIGGTVPAGRPCRRISPWLPEARWGGDAGLEAEKPRLVAQDHRRRVRRGCAGDLLYAANVTDLSAAVGKGALTAWAGSSWRCIWCSAGCFWCSAAIGRRTKPLTLVQTPVQKRRLSRRTAAAAAVSILLLIPVTLFVGFLPGQHCLWPHVLLPCCWNAWCK